MSKNTGKPALTPKPRKRAKRVVENDAYGAMVRRMVRSYGRRVATGDVESLVGLTELVSEVDTAGRVAVLGLRRFGFSWADIATRLGVSKQAVQMRYGSSAAERGGIDERIRSAGADVTLATLVRVFADHFPGSSPRPSACRQCGYRYPDDKSECPTMSVVRPLLYRRRTENPAALEALTGEQHEDLVKHSKPKSVRTSRFTVRTGRPAPCPEPVHEPSLLDLINGKDPTP